MIEIQLKLECFLSKP